jgi:hypothetical protein
MVVWLIDLGGFGVLGIMGRGSILQEFQIMIYKSFSYH